ncbi:MAG: ATP-binding protein [Chloroflexota bacterium]
MSTNMEHLADILRRAQMARQDPEPDEPKQPVCTICQGAGYLRYDVPADDPHFGELVVCDCTRAELEAKRQRFLLERSQLADLQHFTFETFLLKFRQGAPPPHSPDAGYHLARKYADATSEMAQPWLFLYGTKGTGKTHLAAAIGNARIARGQPAIFMVVPDLLDHLRATFSPNSDTSYDDLFESLRNTSLLILDDLGTQTATPWAREKLYQLINHRYNRRLPTVITMNQEEAEDIDPRLWSRMNDIQLTRRCEIRDKDKRTEEAPPSRARQPKRRTVREDFQI